MKTVKGLLLGSAAAFVAMSGAQAADLPMAAPVQYVKVCDTYGAGFFYIPGTQTCLQISGFVTAQFRYDEPTARSSNAVNFRGRTQLNFDARSQTPWGTLRAYASVAAYFQNNNTSINQFFYGGAGPRNFANPLGGDPANGAYVANAYVQFAGLTAGYTLSNYTFPLTIPEVAFAPIVDLLPTLQVAYTASFGNGFSATIAVENGSYRNADFAAIGGPAPAISVGPGNSGTRMPDIVGNLRVIQGWGAAQLSAAVHQVRAIGVSTDTNYGFAVQGALKINLPMLGAGDNIKIVGAYANGAMAYLGFGPTNSGGLLTPLGGGYADAWVNPATGNLSNESGWQIMGALQHHWTPSLRSNFVVAYDHDDAPGFVGTLSDLSYLTAGANVIWSPVRDLDIGLEVMNQTAFQNAAQKASLARAGFDDSKWTVISWITRRF